MATLLVTFVDNHIKRHVRRIDPAFLAAAAFVLIQVGIGIIFKIAQRDDGRYAFSQSASIAISEFCKLFLSTIFFYYASMARRAREGLSDPEKQAYTALDHITISKDGLVTTVPSDGTVGQANAEALDVDMIALPHAAVSDTARSSMDSGISLDRPVDSQEISPCLGMLEFISLIRNEIQPKTIYGTAHLALMYAFINNTTFILFQLADPGTIALVKSGITLITALILSCTSGMVITRLQWVAITFQICGVSVTQYNPQHGLLYEPSTYLLLGLQVTVSASAGIFNQMLLQGEVGSSHVVNMALYAFGTLANLIIHVGSRLLSQSEPSFFEGYDSFGAIMVLVSNILIGLAITAVYKYADALVKCFATSVSTGILLYLAPIFFHVPLSFLVIPGSITVFVATWLYIDSGSKAQEWPPTGVDELADLPPYTTRKSNTARLQAAVWAFGPSGALRFYGLVATFSAAFVCILSLIAWSDASPHLLTEQSIIESPLKSTLAFVRWNHHLPERIPLIQEYVPFFQDIHMSLPPRECANNNNQTCSVPRNSNLTYDNWGDSMFIYANVAHTMQSILDAPVGHPMADLTGIFYYHFDAWVDPMGFTEDDLTKIWYPSNTGMPWECFTSPKKKPNWWAFRSTWSQAEKIVSATLDAYNHLDPSLRHRIDPKEWCVGWSDIYYIPRQYFLDYILLSRIYYDHGIIHELAIATMLRTIDVTRRSHPMRTNEVITHLDDCWGGCCKEHPTPKDIMGHRCGHKLDLTNSTLIRHFYDRLDQHAELLGAPAIDTARTSMSKTILDDGDVAAILSIPDPVFRVSG
ncbi:UDP-galactose transporter [Sphaceloma murrayae]|uniref:UDP-galactose transporter n=1 Tax=Sphaceloma murrayae TaxID=2082308 RepID=A0A2K1QFV2_9PEZI|nr:UDP-galactose transporter [Sphaceloma murrayae]